MEKIFELFKIFDIHQTSLNLTLNGKNKSKTFYGAILSMMIISIFFVLLIYLFNDLNTKKNQYYTSNKLRFLDPPNFNITSDFDMSSNDDISLFFFAFQFEEESGEEIPYNLFLEFLYLDIQLITVVKNDKSKNKNDFYGLTPCESIFNDTMEYFELNINNNSLNKFSNSYYCVNATIIELQGDFISLIFKYLAIKFRPCSYNPNKNITCNKDKKKFLKFIKKLKINFLISTDYIKTSKINDIPLEYFTKVYSFKINEILYQKVDNYLSYSFFSSSENLVLDFLGPLTDYYITVPKIIKNYGEFSNSYLAIYLRSNYEYFYITRSYKTFFNLISQLGGIWKFLLILGVSIISKFNLKSMLNKMGNKLYAVISPSKTYDIQETETLDNYKKKGSELNPHEFLITNNKTELEAELYIDIYKFERNKGLSVSMNEMIGHNYFTCCLNDKQIKIKSLEEKLEKEILIKLDFIKILKFMKEFKILKSIILNRRKILIELNTMQNIDFDNIVKFSKKIKKILEKVNKNLDDINSIRRRLKREKFFINGLRYYKSKPIIDKKIDIKIFNMFKWKFEKILRYMNKNHIKNIKNFY